ncbi:hypothetical protein HMI54_002310 [Coelomomyces lativittatus]|nr:hypothetical protein HMI56_003000 [Coelomomyces lativittatus]KAJ1509506.1 hypothetical protein HMI54_002310 [Coelomomyces lativittatus]KAJ1516447.1 hypothetical protein HMI55_002239 [Coelomomyces lativittatus]
MFTLKSVLSPLTFKPVRILCQNDNGPCPLLAICNFLVLQGNLSLSSPNGQVDADAVCRTLANFVVENVNHPHHLNDILSIIPKLVTGLDLNVKFNGYDQFELTKETQLFKSLHIPLVHGWLPNPFNAPTFETVHALSYNEAVMEMVQKPFNSLLIHEFLRDTTLQLTETGFQILSSTMPSGLYVFFWNNHFHVLYKKQENELFLLVTDQGYACQSHIVWEHLTEIKGDTTFVNNAFDRKIPASRSSEPESLDPSVSQIDEDYALAISLIERDQNVYSDSALSNLHRTPSSLRSHADNPSSSKSKDKLQKIKYYCSIM